MCPIGKSVNRSGWHGWKLSGLINRPDRGARERATGTRMQLIIQDTQTMDPVTTTAGVAALRIIAAGALAATGGHTTHSVFKVVTRKAAGRCGRGFDESAVA